MRARVVGRDPQCGLLLARFLADGDLVAIPDAACDGRPPADGEEIEVLRLDSNSVSSRFGSARLAKRIARIQMTLF